MPPRKLAPKALHLPEWLLHIAASKLLQVFRYSGTTQVNVLQDIIRHELSKARQNEDMFEIGIDQVHTFLNALNACHTYYYDPLDREGSRTGVCSPQACIALRSPWSANLSISLEDEGMTIIAIWLAELIVLDLAVRHPELSNAEVDVENPVYDTTRLVQALVTINKAQEPSLPPEMASRIVPIYARPWRGRVPLVRSSEWNTVCLAMSGFIHKKLALRRPILLSHSFPFSHDRPPITVHVESVTKLIGREFLKSFDCSLELSILFDLAHVKSALCEKNTSNSSTENPTIGDGQKQGIFVFSKLPPELQDKILIDDLMAALPQCQCHECGPRGLPMPSPWATVEGPWRELPPLIIVESLTIQQSTNDRKYKYARLRLQLYIAADRQITDITRPSLPRNSQPHQLAALDAIVLSSLHELNSQSMQLLTPSDSGRPIPPVDLSVRPRHPECVISCAHAAPTPH